MIVYFNGRFIPKEQVSISPDDRGFLFADGAYEVIRSYGGRLFRLDDHLARMDRSLRELRIAGPDVHSFGDIADELIHVNRLGQGEASLYVQVTRGAAPRHHTFPDEGTPPTVYAYAAPLRPSPERWERGVKAILVPDIRWTRCDIKSLALLPNVLASQRAAERGAYEAVFVRDGAVTEGAHTNVCAVLDGRLVTHPRTHHILGGITRRVVLELCGQLDIPVEESPILETRVGEVDEFLLLGTVTEILPVVRVDGWQVGDGTPGSITRKLQRAFRGLTR